MSTDAPIRRPVLSACRVRSSSACVAAPATSRYCPPTMPSTPVAAASSATRGEHARRLALLRGQQEPERLGVERVAGEDRDVLAELTWQVGPPAAQVVVVHRREVVVDQRVGVDQLDRRRERQHVARVALRRAGGRERQHRADALAAGEQAVAHRLLQAGRPRGRRRREAQLLEVGLDLLAQRVAGRQVPSSALHLSGRGSPLAVRDRMPRSWRAGPRRRRAAQRRRESGLILFAGRRPGDARRGGVRARRTGRTAARPARTASGARAARRRARAARSSRRRRAASSSRRRSGSATRSSQSSARSRGRLRARSSSRSPTPAGTCSGMSSGGRARRPGERPRHRPDVPAPRADVQQLRVVRHQPARAVCTALPFKAERGAGADLQRSTQAARRLPRRDAQRARPTRAHARLIVDDRGGVIARGRRQPASGERYLRAWQHRRLDQLEARTSSPTGHLLAPVSGTNEWLPWVILVVGALALARSPCCSGARSDASPAGARRQGAELAALQRGPRALRLRRVARPVRAAAHGRRLRAACSSAATATGSTTRAGILGHIARRAARLQR